VGEGEGGTSEVHSRDKRCWRVACAHNLVGGGRLLRITSGWMTAGGHCSVGGRLVRTTLGWKAGSAHNLGMEDGVVHIISGWRAGGAHELRLEGGWWA
jgi:hypothetical protein